MSSPIATGACTIYCVHLNGVRFTSAQCVHLITSQLLHLWFCALCMNRVYQLVSQSGTEQTGFSTARSYGKRSLMRWMFALRSLFSMVALGFSIALLIVLYSKTFSAALVIGNSIHVFLWWFYLSVLHLEYSRVVTTRSVGILLFLLFAAVDGIVLNGIYGRSNDWRLYPYVQVLMKWRSVAVCGIAVLSLAQLVHIHTQVIGRHKLSLSPSHIISTQRSSPFDRADWLSRISYLWISPFITLGKQRRFELIDVPELPVRDSTSTAASRFKETLEREFRQHNRDQQSFLRVLRRLYGWEIAMFALWSTANTLIGLLSPLLIKLFLDWSDEQQPAITKGYYLAAAMIGRSVLSSVSTTQYSLAWKRFDIRVRAGVVSAIYNRTLFLSSTTKRRYGLGKITNLISVDIGRLVGMPGTLFNMFLIPMEIVLALLLLSKEVSYAFVAGVVVLCIMLPIQTFLGGKIQSVTKMMLKYRDERVNLTAESLKSIRTLKLLGWIDSYLRKMDTYRTLEMGQLTVRKYLDALCVFFWASTPVIVQTSVFVTVIYTGHDITAANAFTTVSLLDRLIFPMNYFPWIINGFLEARVSALRIREFLFSCDDNDTYTMPTLLPPLSIKDKTTISPNQKHTVEMTECEFAWNTNDSTELDDKVTSPLIKSSSTAARFTLYVNDLKLRQDALYVICGPVGAGKSSLLLAMLGEMPQLSGKLSILKPRASYCPQTPWLFRASVRQNITMCDDDMPLVDDELYQRVLVACGLDKDLETRRKFDLEQVAENGSNFSGGQKLRINLARALYQRVSLYLIDDSLSGLDPKTAQNIIKNCFSSTNDSARILPVGASVALVTHSIHLLPLFPADVEAVVMDSGEIVEKGTFEALTKDDSTSRLQTMIKNVEISQQTEHTNTDTKEATKSNDTVTFSASEEHEKQSEEHREIGVVNLRVWKEYASSIGWTLSISIFVSICVMQVSRNGLDWWISFYTNGHHSVTPTHFANILLWITVVNCVSVFFRSFLFAFGGIQAAKAIYTSLVTKIFGTSLSFFDVTPIGRILNRLSSDTYSVDETLPFTLNIFIKDLADVVGTLVILAYGNKFVLLLLIPLSFIYFRLQNNYRPTSRHIKRLHSVTQSSIMGMFTETLDGLSVIRAMKLQHEYSLAYRKCLNLSQRMSFFSANAGSWFGIRLDMLGVCVTSFVGIFAVIDFHLTGKVDPGILGLTLTYALPIVSKLNALLNSFIDTERKMITVERVKEYTDLPPEEDVVISTPHQRLLDTSWPSQGKIEISGLSVSYTSHLNHTAVMALTDFNYTIEAGERIGICGRTGAGKSTLLNSIFRVVPWYSGCISIDGINLKTLPLQTLRSRLTYVPQEIVLFSGTVRSNLDPEERFDDHVIWTSLAKCKLDVAISKLPNGLYSSVEGAEATFSKGQSQLLCIARALLHPSKVLCIDEATASIDQETEIFIAKTLQQEFVNSTVIAVAHRIKTIMDCDRVLVIDKGRLVESGKPRDLANDSATFFYNLANA